MTFPPYLTELNLGEWNGTVAELPPLPTGLRKLVIPFFRQSVRDLIHRLPISLTEVSFGSRTCVDESLDDVDWPPLIRVLEFFYCVQPLINWHPPASLETLNIGWTLPLSDLCLPATLQRLSFGFRELQSPIDASYCWPSHLRTLYLGQAF